MKGCPEANHKVYSKEVVFNQGYHGFAARDNRSFVEVIKNKKEKDKEINRKGKSFCALSFEVDEEVVSYYGKAYVGVMKDPESAFSIKVFHEEGIFSIRVTPLGASTCLLEDLIDGEVAAFIEERREWW